MHRECLEAESSPIGLEELGEALGVETSVVIEYVELGLAGPHPEPAGGWRFTPPEAARLSRAVRIARELELHAAAAALIVDLLEERERMRRRIAGLERLAGSAP
jgi:chaperone modulatory protein CbpM